MVASGTGTGSSCTEHDTNERHVWKCRSGIVEDTRNHIEESGNSNITISGDGVTGTGLARLDWEERYAYAGTKRGAGGGVRAESGRNVTGSITITSNATNGTSIAAPITGTGVVSTKVIDVPWQPSASSGVIGYYVYRSSVSGGPYTKLVGSAIAGTGYADNNVALGSYYYYVVTAVSSRGAESVYSNQAGIKVP